MPRRHSQPGTGTSLQPAGAFARGDSSTHRRWGRSAAGPASQPVPGRMPAWRQGLRPPQAPDGAGSASTRAIVARGRINKTCSTMQSSTATALISVPVPTMSPGGYNRERNA